MRGKCSGAWEIAADRRQVGLDVLLEEHPGPLLVPVLVITEVTYLLGSRLGVEAEVRFLGSYPRADRQRASIAPLTTAICPAAGWTCRL